MHKSKDIYLLFRAFTSDAKSCTVFVNDASWRVCCAIIVFMFLISRSSASLDVPLTLAAEVGSAGSSDSMAEPAAFVEEVGNGSIGDYGDINR